MTPKGKVKKNKLTSEIIEMVLENMVDWVLIIDQKTHKWIYSNPACKKLLGYKPAEIIGQNTLTSPVISPESREIIKQNWGKLIKEGFLSGVNIELLNKKGERVPSNYSEGVIKNKKGEITHRIVIVRDIREINRLTDELKISKQNLEKKLSEVEKINKLMAGREIRMAELKKEIAQLKEEIESLRKK